MRMPVAHSPARGQTSLEYLLLLMVVAVVVIASFSNGSLVDKVHDSAADYYNTVTKAIMAGGGASGGNNPIPINGGWCPVTCPPLGSYGFNVMYRACECPAPAFGGDPCPPAGTYDPACQPGQTCMGSQVTCGGVNSCGSCPTGQICIAGGGCECPNSLNCSAIIPGSIPDGTCGACICPQYTYLAGNQCISCPAFYTYNGTECVPLTCGPNASVNPAGTGCECDLGAYWNGNACAYCPTGQYYNGTSCTTCPLAGGQCQVYNQTTHTCQLPTCPAGMYFDCVATDPSYYTCRCMVHYGYNPVTGTCVQNYICESSTFPANVTVCPHTKTIGTPAQVNTVPWTVVASVGACVTNAQCQAYSDPCLVATLPPHSIACPAPSPGIPIPAAGPPNYTLVYTCDNTQACEAVCNPNQQYGLESGHCVSMYMCPLATLPPNTFPCPNPPDPNNFPPNVPYGSTYSSSNVVPQESSCGNIACEAYSLAPCTVGTGCSGKVCGEDACLNANGCGLCPYSPAQQCVAGQCTCPHPGICPPGAVCGPDTCGNANGCGGANPCSATQICSSGQCVCRPGICPTGAVCGPDTCGNINGCAICHVGYACDLTLGDAQYGQCIPCPMQGVCPSNGHGGYNQCGPDTCGYPDGCGGPNACSYLQHCDLTLGDPQYGQCVCTPRAPCAITNCGKDDCGSACPVTCSPAAGVICSTTTTLGTCICTSTTCPSPGTCVGSVCKCPAQSLPLNSTTASFSPTNAGTTGSGTCFAGSGTASAACVSGTWGTATGTCCISGYAWNGTACKKECLAGILPLNSTTASFPLTAPGSTASGTCTAGSGTASAMCSVGGGTWGTATGTCCRSGYAWNGSACEKECLAGILPLNSTTASFPLTVAGATANGTCTAGSGTASATCSASGGTWGTATGTCCRSGYTWNGSACEKECLAGRLPLNSTTASFSLTVAGATASGTCTAGSGTASATCSASGGTWGTATGTCCALNYTWNGSACEKECLAGSLSLNSTTASFTLTPAGATASGTCTAGSGTASATCSASGGTWGTATGTCCALNYTWNGSACEKECLAGRLPLNSTTASFSLTVAGATASGTCTAGSGTASATCGASGGTWGTATGTCCASGYTWTGSACEKECLAGRLSLNSTTASFSLTPAGATASGTCTAGSGTASATCGASGGTWGTATGTCCALNYTWNGFGCMTSTCAWSGWGGFTWASGNPSLTLPTSASYCQSGVVQCTVQVTIGQLYEVYYGNTCGAATITSGGLTYYPYGNTVCPAGTGTYVNYYQDNLSSSPNCSGSKLRYFDACLPTQCS